MKISEFVASFVKGGPARTSNFLISVTPPASVGATGSEDMRQIQYRIDSATLPGRSVSIFESNINSEPTYQIAGTTSFDPVNLGIIVSDDFSEKHLFEKWMDIVCGGDYRVGESNDFRLNYYDEMKGQITIQLYDDTGTLANQIQLIDAFPVALTFSPLTWEGKEVLKMTATIAYRFYQELQQ